MGKKLFMCVHAFMHACTHIINNLYSEYKKNFQFKKISNQIYKKKTDKD